MNKKKVAFDLFSFLASHSLMVRFCSIHKVSTGIIRIQNIMIAMGIVAITHDHIFLSLF